MGRNLGLDIFRGCMTLAKTLLIPSFSITTITASTNRIILNVVMSLMISFCKALRTYTWTTTLHALKTSKRSSFSPATHRSGTYWALVWIRNLIVPVENLSFSYIIKLKQFFNKLYCSFGYLRRQVTCNLFQFYKVRNTLWFAVSHNLRKKTLNIHIVKEIIIIDS